MKRILSTKLFTIVAGILVLFFGISVLRLLPNLRQHSEQLAHINQQIAQTEEQKQKFARESDYLKSEAYMERQARMKLNYKKPGEQVVFVYKNGYNDPVKATAPPKGIASASQLSSMQLPHWRQWLLYLWN